MRGSLPAIDSYARIEAGPDMCGPSPARPRAFPLWTVRTIFAVIMLAALGISAPTRGGSWIGIGVAIGGALTLGLGLRGRKM